jgi:dihydroorotate dehydrogenase (NAD+) catalytic subunit
MTQVSSKKTAADTIDLSVEVGPLRLGNPLMTASGTAGLGLELEPFYDLREAGAIVVKTLTRKPRRGNPMPRLCETPSGLLNSIGLPNKGLDDFLARVMPRLAGKADCLVVNIAGTCTGEFGEMAAQLDGVEGVDALELNISCPNVEGGDLPFSRDPQVVQRLVADVRAATDLPLITKLSPNVSDISEIALAAVEGGTDIVSLINTVLGMSVDWRSGKPALGTVIGGLSGPAIKPIALRMVWEVARSVDVPVIGIGGIRTADDVLDYLCAGASAVQVGTTHYPVPDVIPRLVGELRERLAEVGRRDVRSLIGSVKAG